MEVQEVVEKGTTPAGQNWTRLNDALENVIDILEAGKATTTETILGIRDALDTDGEMLEDLATPAEE